MGFDNTTCNPGGYLSCFDRLRPGIIVIKKINSKIHMCTNTCDGVFKKSSTRVDGDMLPPGNFFPHLCIDNIHKV